MSRATVRAQIAAWLAPPNVPGLNTVLSAPPRRLEGGSWAPTNASPAGAWGAAGYVHLMEVSRRRRALGGEHGGIKQVTYQVSLILPFRYVPGPDDVDTTGWADAHDSLIDAVVARIEADRTFGSVNGDPIWQVGEGAPGGAMDDIRIQTDLPQPDGGQVLVWSVLEFVAVEMTTA